MATQLSVRNDSVVLVVISVRNVSVVLGANLLLLLCEMTRSQVVHFFK